MARKSTPPQIDKNTKGHLLACVNSHTIEKRMAFRAQIILDWNEGLTYEQSSEYNNTSQKTVSKWRQRFKADGLEGLNDKPRSGRNPTITEETRKMVIHYACSRPEDERRRRSQHEVAELTGISQSKVSDILRQEELQPHKTQYWCGKSPDPRFEEKMVEIVGLYLDPAENALVLSVDEKTQIQALDRTQPELPLRKGDARRLTNTYKRNGTVNLMASLAVHSGEITTREVSRNNSDNFLKFLRVLDRKYRNVQIHLIMDNLSMHKSKKVKKWLSKKRKFHVHYTPTYSSWLNQIEIWFSILTRHVLKDAVWHSKKQLIDTLIQYIKTYNENMQKPFKWTYGKNKIN